MDVCFDCTQCGRCCHDLRLTLSVAEARTWAGRGHRVDLLAEAWAWPDADEPDAATQTQDNDDAAVRAWRQATTFPVVIGDIPFRVNLRLVAHHAGPCPHLLPDMRCGNYAQRPRICRIYPLESRPFEPMQPAQRKCPPDAWIDGLPVIERDGLPADAEAAAIIGAHRAEMIADVTIKARLARVIGLAETALAGEGLAVCPVAPDVLVEALDVAARGAPDVASPWGLVTNRRTTQAMLADMGCPVQRVNAGERYLASFADMS